tara:strand:- start:344 stop:616 length:273 start_codon:yes stop_codon:yes gene_type:complete
MKLRDRDLVQPNGRYYDHREDPNLNVHQREHLEGTFNVYAPIEAYVEEWEHTVDEKGQFVLAHPIPGTREKRNLPAIAQQWRSDWEKYNV